MKIILIGIQGAGNRLKGIYYQKNLKSQLK